MYYYSNNRSTQHIFVKKKKKKIVKVQATIKKVYDTTCIFKLQYTSQIQKKDT